MNKLTTFAIAAEDMRKNVTEPSQAPAQYPSGLLLRPAKPAGPGETKLAMAD